VTTQEAYAVCRGMVRQSGSTFYYGMRLLPRSKRDAIYTLYAWSRLADDAVDDDPGARPPLEALSRIGDLLDRSLARGYRQDSHPVVVALGESIHAFHLPERCFRDLLAGMGTDVDPKPFDTFEELLVYCRRVAGTVGELCLEIFGYRDQSARQLAVDLGVAMQLTNILRDLAEDLERGRIYLPLHDFAQAGYSVEALSRRERTGAFRDLMRQEAARAHTYYQQARPLVGLVDADAQWSIAVLYGVYRQLLSKIEALDYNVFERRVRLSAVEKAWMAASALGMRWSQK